MGEPARCRSCSQPVVWATMPSGKLNPLDAHPVADGNVAAYRDSAGDLLARVLKAGEEPMAHELRGTSHFATCSDPGAHRRKGRDSR